MTRRIALLIGLLFELIAVFGLFLPAEMIRANGKDITLQTAPVDPWSMFRGQYVVLNYEAGLNMPMAVQDNRTIYVVLAVKGDVYQRVSYSTEKPVLKEGEACLRGKLDYNRVTFPDIAQYFVSQEQAAQIQNAANTHNLLVDVKVTPDCQAIIQGIRIGSEAPPAPVTLGVPRPVEAPKPPLR